MISCDPKRQYVFEPADVPAQEGKLPAQTVLKMAPGDEGPGGEGYAWYACTIQGGRATRPLDAIGLAVACEALGAGEILLNCIDKDGTNSGFDVRTRTICHLDLSIARHVYQSYHLDLQPSFQLPEDFGPILIYFDLF